MDKFCVLVLMLFLSNCNLCLGITDQELMSNLLKDYVKSALPSSTSPTEVKLGVYFNKLGELDSPGDMTFSSNFYLRLNWKDPRLKFDPADIDGRTQLRIGDDLVDKIWKPDVFFRNGFDITKHESIRDNALLKLNSTGFLWFVVHITASFHCPMKLQKYPFDTQTCPIMFESFGHTMDQYYFSWLDSPAQIDESNEIPAYALEGVTQYDCSQNYTAGAFPCLEMRFVLRRDSGYFFIQTFIPTMILVIMSWFVLWLDIQEFTHRLGLTFLLMVCMILMHVVVGNQVAQVSYTKALDVWMFMCLLFIFGVLLESLVVKVIYSRSYKPAEHVNLDDPTVKRVHDNKVTRLIDLVSRAVFPLLYLLFIIIFFGIYRA